MWRLWRERRVFEALFYFLRAELSSLIPLESDMKKQEHLWQNHSPNFLAEKVFNTAMAALPPHCAVCSLFCPFIKVRQHWAANEQVAKFSWEYSMYFFSFMEIQTHCALIVLCLHPYLCVYTNT